MFRVMSELYHNRVLELAAGIPHVGDLESPDGSVLKVSRVCGSTVKVDLTLDEAASKLWKYTRQPHESSPCTATQPSVSEHSCWQSAKLAMLVGLQYGRREPVASSHWPAPAISYDASSEPHADKEIASIAPKQLSSAGGAAPPREARSGRGQSR